MFVGSFAIRLPLLTTSQLIAIYDIIHKYESASHNSEGRIEEEAEDSTPRTTWAVEALAWIDTYEAVTRHKIDAELSTGVKIEKPLTLARFAKCCEPSSGGGIDLCDSTKDRTSVLVHLFRPLLGDIFVFKVVNSVFDKMGILKDKGRAQRYFGEWFMSLPAPVAAKSSLLDTWSSPVRWLQDMVSDIVDEFIAAEMSSEVRDFSPNDANDSIFLSELYRFCTKADDLPKAFLLATACREAVSAVTKQKEEKTYGKVLRAAAGEYVGFVASDVLMHHLFSNDIISCHAVLHS